MSARLLAALLATAALLAACGGGGAPAIPTVEPPAAVPTAARPLAAPTEVGHIEHPLGPKPDVSGARLLNKLTCEDQALIVRTDRETVYARMPCDRFLPPDRVAALIGQPAAIVVEKEDGLRLKILSTAGTAEFTVEGVWVEEE